MKKFIKRTVIFALAFAMLLTSACAHDHNVSESEKVALAAELAQVSEVPATINEYQAYLASKAEEISTLSADSASVNDEYVDALRDLTRYSSVELKRMGYSSGNIAIVEKLKSDPAYVPSSSELSRAASTLQFTFVCTNNKVRDTYSYFDFSWWFRWNSTPAYRSSDIVVAHWYADYILSESTPTAEIIYTNVTTNGEDIIKTVNFDSEARNGISPSNKTWSLQFPMNQTTTVNGTKYQIFSKEGSGSFRLRCDMHNHTTATVDWEYGHSIIEITGDIGFEIGTIFPTITFAEGTERMVEGSAIFYAN